MPKACNQHLRIQSTLLLSRESTAINDNEDLESYLSSLLSLLLCGGTLKATDRSVLAMIDSVTHDDDEHGAWGRHGTNGGEGGDGGCQRQLLAGGKIPVKKRGGEEEGW
jgi:hypothetical protein